MKPGTRKCKFCDKPIDLLKGRRDRQFCDERCKNSYHNSIAFEEEKEAKRINKILKKNRDILQKMTARKDKNEITKERLLKAGFDFTYYTHHKFTIHYNYQYTFCYDYGYRPVKPESYKIVKAFEEKEEWSKILTSQAILKQSFFEFKVFPCTSLRVEFIDPLYKSFCDETI